METPDPTHSVYPLNWQFWYQSQFNVGLTSLHQYNQKIFQMLNWLERSKLYWFNFILELHKKYVDISMPRYIPTEFNKFQHKSPERPQDSSHPWSKSVYGKHIQLSTQQSSTQKLNSADTNRVQSINGTFPYYDQAVDSNMIPALNEVSTC